MAQTTNILKNVNITFRRDCRDFLVHGLEVPVTEHLKTVSGNGFPL
jgi:hypothetical protein